MSADGLENSIETFSLIFSIIRDIVLACALSGLWSRLVEREKSLRRGILFMSFFTYMLVTEFVDFTFLDINFLPRYLPVVIGCVIYCYAFHICGWEQPVFTLLFLYNLHTLSFTIADSIYITFINRMNASIDMSAADAIDRIYINTYAGIAVLTVSGIMLICALYLLFTHMRLDISGISVWEFAFLSVLNIFGIFFSYTMLNISMLPFEDGVFVLFDEAPDMVWRLPVLAALLLAGEYSSMYVFGRYREYLAEREYIYVREQSLRSLQHRLEEAQVLYGDLRTLKHDMKNHMQTVRGLIDSGDRDGAREYVERMDRLTDGIDLKFKTGSALCDVVLSDKWRLAAQENISMDVYFAYPEGIGDFDMGIILSNLCDNAIEACARMTARTDRHITLRLTDAGACVILDVMNPYDGVIEYDHNSGLPNTVKSDSDAMPHGIGLKTVAKLADDYLGRLDVSASEGLFTVSVMLQKRHL